MSQLYFIIILFETRNSCIVCSSILIFISLTLKTIISSSTSYPLAPSTRYSIVNTPSSQTLPSHITPKSILPSPTSHSLSSSTYHPAMIKIYSRSPSSPSQNPFESLINLNPLSISTTKYFFPTIPLLSIDHKTLSLTMIPLKSFRFY